MDDQDVTMFHILRFLIVCYKVLLEFHTFGYSNFEGVSNQFYRFSNNSILHKTVNTNVMIGGPFLSISELVNFQCFMNLVNSSNLITHF